MAFLVKRRHIRLLLPECKQHIYSGMLPPYPNMFSTAIYVRTCNKTCWISSQVKERQEEPKRVRKRQRAPGSAKERQEAPKSARKRQRAPGSAKERQQGMTRALDLSYLLAGTGSPAGAPAKSAKKRLKVPKSARRGLRALKSAKCLR